MINTAEKLDIEATVEESFREVIGTMFGLQVERKSELTISRSSSLAGMIGLAGRAFHGLIQICCDEAGARTLAAAMLGGEEMLEDEDIVHDSLGELANMLGGAVKQRIDTTGTRVEISLPSVLKGEFATHEVGASERVDQCYHVAGSGVRVTLVYNTNTAAS